MVFTVMKFNAVAGKSHALWWGAAYISKHVSVKLQWDLIIEMNLHKDALIFILGNVENLQRTSSPWNKNPLENSIDCKKGNIKKNGNPLLPEWCMVL